MDCWEQGRVSSLGALLVWDTEDGRYQCCDSQRKKLNGEILSFCKHMSGQEDLMHPLAAMFPRLLYDTVTAWREGVAGTCCNAQ